MIEYIEGTLASKDATRAVVDVGGIGLSAAMSANSLAGLPDKGHKVRVLCHLEVHDDSLALFGFLRQDEKDLFARLVGVSGVGPKVAMAALSTYRPQALSKAIVEGDVKAISRVPGIGKKTAQRIVLELQGSLATDRPAPASGSERKGVEEALLSMGFTSEEAALALKGAPVDADEGSMLHYALKRLGERR